jgi:hypothetical protein
MLLAIVLSVLLRFIYKLFLIKLSDSYEQVLTI